VTKRVQTDNSWKGARWLRARLVAVGVVVAMIFGLAVPAVFAASAGADTTPPAAATPAAATPAANSAPSTVFSFKQLGLPQSYTFASGGTTVGVQLPVPDKLQPASLWGTLVIPPDFGTGTIVINSGTQYIGAINLPANSDQQQKVPFATSIANAPVAGGYETFNMVLEQSNAGGTPRSSTCSGALPLQLIDPTAVYTGSFATPDSVATFFPPVLHQLVMYVPSVPTPSEESAALTIAAGVASAYQLVPVAVSVKPWDGTSIPTLPSGTLVRGILIHQSGTAGVQLTSEPSGNALLSVTGSATTLPEQGTLLSSTIAKLVQTTNATVLKPLLAPTVQLNPITFNQLGLTGTSTFSGQQQLSFAIDETRLGGVATSMAVVLKAAYSPVETGAKATAQVSVGGVTLATQQLDGSGTLDLPFTIPAPVIRRSTVVLLTVTYFPAGFSCQSAGRTMSFTVDPRSTVQVTNAPGGTGGFPGLPQSLVPNFQVAFDTPGAARLSTAVQTVCGLQRLSSVLLRPSVVSLAEAEGDQQPLLLVSADNRVPANMGAPLQYRGQSVYRVDSQSQGAFAMSSRLASLQVFDQTARNRTVVLASTSENWALMDRLFATLGNTSAGWSALSGDVVAIGATGTMVNLTVKAGGTPLFTATTHSNTSLYEAIGALFVLILLALAAWAVIRYRRRSADLTDDAAREAGSVDDGTASTASAGGTASTATDDGSASTATDDAGGTGSHHDG
jgi:hypothetical protein